jgi:hypothetical protein
MTLPLLTSDLATARHGDEHRVVRFDLEQPPDPNPSCAFFHAAVDLETKIFGASVELNVWSPHVDDGEDHSLMELWVVRDAGPASQSVEAGWMVSWRQYGDGEPHLFTWFTTNNWGDQADNVGGYDTSFKGWQQVDDTIYPGAVLTEVSRPDDEVPLQLAYQFVDGNWWLWVRDRWIGYYPGSLFTEAAANPSLCEGTTRVAFGGEVCTSNPQPTTTRTEMGSGEFPTAGVGRCCSLDRLLVQPQLGGPMTDLSGAAVPQVDAVALYALAASYGDPARGSFVLAGGPGGG